MYELIGYQYCDIPARSRNESPVVGHSCWFAAEETSPEFKGRSAVKVFFSDERYPEFQPAIGDKYLLIFNQKGKLQAYQKLDN